MSRSFNEKDCRNALCNLSAILATRKYDKELTRDYIEMLDNLIHEHFYNPSLKWEELEKNTIVWDNKYKTWIYISELDDFFYDIYLNGYCKTGFEKDRFFRKQVEE